MSDFELLIRWDEKIRHEGATSVLHVRGIASANGEEWTLNGEASYLDGEDLALSQRVLDARKLAKRRALIGFGVTATKVMRLPDELLVGGSMFLKGWD